MVVCLLRRFDFSRKADKVGELEARETGDEHASNHAFFPLPFLPCVPTTETPWNEAGLTIQGVDLNLGGNYSTFYISRIQLH